MVFNATFNNISVISWRSVLLMKEPEVPEVNHLLVDSENDYSSAMRLVLKHIDDLDIKQYKPKISEI